VSDAKNDNDLFGESSAMVWAERFVKRVTENPTIATDVGAMLAWFSGAIMAGHDHALATHPERKRASDRDFVLLPRGPFFEFLARMALPPWTDENGEQIGGGIDCAPIASELVEWVNKHDLGELYGALREENQ